MSINTGPAFKLSQSAKRLIATSGKNTRELTKIWVQAEANAQFKPRKITRTDQNLAD